MIEFIVCEDSDTFLEKNKNTINKIMFSNNIDYNIYTFKDYNDELQNIIDNNENNKIYILDIELENYSGIDIARKIRKNDWNSLIIFSTAHFELFPHVFSNKLMIFDYISKFDNYENKLEETIKKCINIIFQDRSLNFKMNFEYYNIKINTILYISTDKYKRKTIIKTNNNTYYINESLSSLTNKLDDNFKKINRSLIINMNMVNKINYNEKFIAFNNGEKIENISIKKETT